MLWQVRLLRSVLGSISQGPRAVAALGWARELRLTRAACALGAACCCAAGPEPHVEGGVGPAGGHHPAGVYQHGCRAVPRTYMTYVRWLEWRKETGSRRVKRRDGRSTSTAEEVALWRSVMDFLHDVNEEEEEEEEDDEDESPPPEEPVDDFDGPELIPDAGDGLSEAAGCS